MGRDPALHLLLFALIAVSPGCATREGRCVPNACTQCGPLVDLSPPSNPAAENKDFIYELITNSPASAPDDANVPTSGPQYQVLALSGGAVFGAYTAGVLNGWTQSGHRPTFDVVTGVSTGGLISTFAFLGPKYDQDLCELYTTVRTRDIYRSRPTIALLWSDAAASSAPLKRIIDDRIDCELLREVAAAHARGRRLFVGTTNLDQRRLVVWDMGAIASSGRPDALQLYRTVILASASVPGIFPPVTVPVTVNGKPFEEMHVDGAATSQVFLPGAVFQFDRERLKRGEKPLTGSNVYVILAGKLYADPDCVEPRVKSIASAALTSLTFAQTREDMTRIWTACNLLGIRYHSSSLPLEAESPRNSLEFDPVEMQGLYRYGLQAGMNPRSWRRTPPGAEINEQRVPRTGTDFLAPVVPQQPCAPRRHD